MKTKLFWVSGVLLLGNALAQSGSAGVNWQTVGASAAGALITALIGGLWSNHLQRGRDYRLEKLKAYQKLAEEVAGLHKEVHEVLTMLAVLNGIMKRIKENPILIQHSAEAYETSLNLVLQKHDEASKKLLFVQNTFTLYAASFYNGKGLWVTPRVDVALNAHLEFMSQHLAQLRESLMNCEPTDRMPDLTDLGPIADLDPYSGVQDQVMGLGKVMALMKRDMHR